MIHFIKEGEIRRVGLNLYRTRGGFVAVWAWYDTVTDTMSFHRFRLRLHIRPWIILSSGRFGVLKEYLVLHNLALVSFDELKDLRAMKAAQKRVNEPHIKPQ